MAALINLRYQILNALGEGGFGKTFLAKDTQMPSQRRCVIKQLKPVSDRPEVFDLVRQRFDREAAVLEAVGKGHSQIPDLYAYFEEKGQFYLVQEWIEGQPLSSLVSNPWSEEQVRSLLIHLVDPLSHVHTSNLIHRDIKPDNIILRQVDQLPCLIDFGAVKELMNTVADSEGKSSWSIGTPGFMPAEQAIGRPTFSSDLYSLGMTAIYLLSGRSPQQLPTDSHTGEPIWRQFVPNLSEPFAQVLTRAVQPVAQNRYFSAADMRTALLDLSTQPSASLPTAASIKPPTETSRPPSRTAPAVAPLPAAPPSGSSTAETAVVTEAALHQPTPQTTKARPQIFMRWGLAAVAAIIGFGVLIGVRSQGVSSEVQAAIADYEEGDYEASLTQLGTILERSPDNVTALITKGEVQKSTGDYAGAQTTFTQAIEEDSKSTDALNLRGDINWTIGEYDKALADYRSALRIDPDYAKAYEGLAYVQDTRGQSQEALKNLDLAIEKDASLISAYVLRGNIRADENDQAGAAEDWEKAVAIEPETADDYLMRGKAKSRLNDKSGAMSDFNQALILNPNFAPAHTARAFPLLEQGEVEQSLKEIDNALAINPNLVSALFVQSFFASLNPEANPQDNIDLYSRALAINPNDTGMLNGRCTAYTATRQFDLALADCSKGLEIDPTMTDLYNNRGNAYDKQDNHEAAIKDYSRAIELLTERDNEPAAASAYSNRSNVLTQLQDYEGALADIDKAVELSPETPSYYLSRGMLRSLLGDRENGRTDMQKAADLYLARGDTDGRKNVLYIMEKFEL